MPKIHRLAKKWLFPSKANKYHPHLLRPLGLVIVCAAIAILPTIYNFSATHKAKVLSYAIDVSSSAVVALTNQQRQQAGLSSLDTSSLLNQAAQAKAQDMFAKDYWAHIAPDGTLPWTFITSTGYRYSAAAENLAEGFSTSSGVVNGWMGSAEHRINILNAAYTQIGVAAVNGTLQGSETTLVVAYYATPYQAPAPVAAPAPPSSPPASVKGSNNSPPAKPANPPPAAPVDNSSPPAPAKKLEKVTVTGQSTTQKTAYVPSAKISLVSQIGHYFNRLNWGQQATIFILVLTMLLVILRHTVIWRTQKRGFRHIWFRAHPIAQLGVLSVAIIVVISTGVGVIK